MLLIKIPKLFLDQIKNLCNHNQWYIYRPTLVKKNHSFVSIPYIFNFLLKHAQKL